MESQSAPSRSLDWAGSLLGNVARVTVERVDSISMVAFIAMDTVHISHMLSLSLRGGIRAMERGERILNKVQSMNLNNKFDCAPPQLRS
jgi:hypothetical protein